MSSSLEYRDRERQRKRESRRQASQAQRERERQRARERRRNCSDEQWEREQERNRERRRNFTEVGSCFVCLTNPSLRHLSRSVEFQRKWTWIRRIIFLLWFAAVKLFWPVFKFDKIKRKEFKKDIMLIDVFIIQSFWWGKPEVILKLCNWCNFSTNSHLLN